jgi:hypothetical protein
MKHTLTKKEEKTLMKLVVHPTNNKVGHLVVERHSDHIKRIQRAKGAMHSRGNAV